jgi:hypothetical protein
MVQQLELLSAMARVPLEVKYEQQNTIIEIQLLPQAVACITLETK